MQLGRFEDERGVIQDLLAQIDAVTRIDSVKGAIRGNHVHRRTTQWTYVVTGRLLVASDHAGVRVEEEYGPGQMAVDHAGVPHAWQALEDTVVLVFTKGPRSGAAYETDTERLAVPLLS